MVDRWLPGSILGVAVALLLTAPRAESATYSDYGITVRGQWASLERVTHGYVEHRFEIESTSNESHQIQLSIVPQYTGMRGTHVREISTTVTVDAKKKRIVSLFQPSHPPTYDSYLRVTIDGDEQERSETISRRGSGYASSRSTPQLLCYVSPAFARETFLRGASSLHTVAAPESLQTWSTNWLGYTCYDVIGVTGTDLKEMPPLLRSVIWRYVESGGTLVILGGAAVPKTWVQEPNLLVDNVNGNAYESSRYYGGFGTCYVATNFFDVKRRNLLRFQVPLPHETYVRASASATAQPWRPVESIKEADDRFAIVDDLSIPVRGLFAVMLIFVIVIGPINVSVLNRYKKRLWMLWTVPAISLVTVAAIVCFMLIYEGWNGHQRTETFTYLDQTNERATTIGWTGFYTPVVPSDGLHFSRETELILQDADASRRYSGSGGYYPRGGGTGKKRCYVDWSEDQHLTQGWLSARVPSHFKVRKSEASKLRLMVNRLSDDELRVVNLLSAPVQRVWIMDEQRRIYAAQNVAPGDKAKAQLARREDEQQIGIRPDVRLRELYQGDWLAGMSRLNRDLPEGYLRPGTYLVELDGAPFLEDGLTKAKTRTKKSWVYGILGEIKKQ